MRSCGSFARKNRRGRVIWLRADNLAERGGHSKDRSEAAERMFRHELDWIVMKALEKDRNRRYETANGFAMDVQRYLADEPVQACPPRAMYRLRKFARRNRGRIMAASVLGIAVLVAVAGIGWAVRPGGPRRCCHD